MSTTLVSPVLVGRHDELGVLRDALVRAAAGAPAIVLVGGEAGVGKSRLVEQAAAEASAGGARVLVGGCVELGGEGLPFAPLVGALRSLARSTSPAELDALLGPARRALARLLPELDPEAALGDTDGPSTGRASQLLEFVLAVVERLAAERPLVLVIEDLHWADRSTLELMTFLVRALRDARVVLLMTYRSDELHRAHPLRPLVSGWERVRSVSRVELARFTSDEVREQLRSILGAEPDEATVGSIFARSEGDAFLVEELLGAAREGADPDDLPPSLRDVLLTRVERLSEPAQRLLRTAAVGGRAVPERLLATVAAIEAGAFYDALREAVDHQLLVVDEQASGYAFRHALARDAVYDDMLPGERVGLHATYGEALAAAPALVDDAATVPALLAHHWAAAHDLPRALAASVQAARQAAAAFAPAEAQRHLERALELWPRVPDAAQRAGMDLADALTGAADAANRAGDVDRSIALVDQALVVLAPDEGPDRRALLLERRASRLRDRGRLGDLGHDEVATLREAQALLPEEPPTLALAVVLNALATTYIRRLDAQTARPLAERGLAASQAVGAQGEEATALITLGALSGYLEASTSGLELLRRGIALAHDIDEVEAELRGYINMSDCLEALGRHEEAAEAARTGIGRAYQVGMARTAGVFLFGNLAEPLLRLGRWDEADAIIAEARRLQPSGLYAATLLAIEAELAAWRGDGETAVRAGADIRKQLGELAEEQFLQPLALVEAEVARAGGDLAAARAAVATGLALGGAERVPRYTWPLVWLGARVEAELAQRARDRREAPPDGAPRARLDELRLALTCRHPAERGHAALAAAELARAAGEPPDWDAAVDAWRAAGEPFPLAYALLRRAEALVAADDREAATAAVRESARIAEELGAPPLAAEATALARRARLSLHARESPAAEPLPGDAVEGLGLTPRERDVLELLAAGRSNGQIAQKLYISPKTASVHVSNILAKLGVAGRVEAAAVAFRLGLGGPDGPSARRGARQ